MHNRRRRIIGVLASVAGLATVLASAGCGSGDNASVVPVSGEVLLDGEPLKFGTVTFQPSRGQPARGEIGSDGKFILSTYRQGDGAAVGRHKVRITCYASQDPSAKKPQARPLEALGESLIPERYTRFDTSGLEVAVLAGGNKPFTFELKREPEAGDDSQETTDTEPGEAAESGEAEGPATEPSSASG